MLKHSERLDTVKPALAAVIKAGCAHLPFDTLVVEGIRTREQMAVNYGKGRTVAECKAKGVDGKYAQPKLAKVTWLNNPFASNHAADSDGKGKAVDVYPLLNGALANTRDHLPLFRQMHDAIMAEAKKAKANVRYGGDWDKDGKLFEQGETDAVHFELLIDPGDTRQA
jgi:peptidoglycan L-alanyl-D-glutamate endopeptidase CwlK